MGQKNRKETTEKLTDTLIYSRLFVARTYHAREVTLDPNTSHIKRIDVVSFIPEGGIDVSGIEKGSFTCFEVKSCKADIYSGSGLNFLGEKNYLVMTAQTYKDFHRDITDGTFANHLRATHPESSTNFGIMVPTPPKIDATRRSDVVAWPLDDPEPFEGDVSDWHMAIISPCRAGYRKRSMVEFLFAMLRAKENYINRRAEYQYEN